MCALTGEKKPVCKQNCHFEVEHKKFKQQTNNFIMSLVKSVKQKVILNVYDLNPQYNAITHAVGFGTYHCGIEFYGQEFSFSEKGMDTMQPRSADNGNTCIFRESIVLGESELTLADCTSGKIKTKLKELGFLGRNYNVTQKNCNHFCEAMARLLLGKAEKDPAVLPKWVNRAASWGNWFVQTFGGNSAAPASSSSKK